MPARLAGLMRTALCLAFLLPATLFTPACPAAADEASSKSPAQQRFEAGVAQLNHKQFAEAEVSFNEALKIDPKFVLPILGLSDLRQQQGDTAGAATYLQRALGMAPDSAGVRTAWGRFLFAQRRYAEAEQAYKKAAELDPKAAVPRGLLGDLYLLGLKKPGEAVDAYEGSLALNASEPHVNFMLGLALLASGRPDEAEAQLTKSRDLDPKNVTIRKDLAELQLRRGELEAAKAQFSDALKLDPHAAWAQTGLGDVAMRRKDYDAAIAAYRDALSQTPGSVEAQTKMAISYELKGDLTSAQDSYKKALEMDPKNAVAANNLAWLVGIKANQPQDALAWADQAVTSNPNSANFLDTKGWILRAAGDKPSALTALKKAAALDPHNPSVLYHLGVLYEETGKPELASTSYAGALAISRTFDGADDTAARLAALKKN